MVFRISLDVDSGFVTRDSWILGRSGGARDPAEVVRERRQRLRHRLRRRLGHAMGRVCHQETCGVHFALCVRRKGRISPQAWGILRGQVHLGSGFPAWRWRATKRLAMCHRALYERQGSRHKFSENGKPSGLGETAVHGKHVDGKQSRDVHQGARKMIQSSKRHPFSRKDQKTGSAISLPSCLYIRI